MRWTSIKKIFILMMAIVVCCGVVTINSSPTYAVDYCNHSKASPTSKVLTVNWHFSGFMPNPTSVTKNCPQLGDFDYKIGMTYDSGGQTRKVTGWKDRRQGTTVNVDTKLNDLDWWTSSFDFDVISIPVERAEDEETDDGANDGKNNEDGSSEGGAEADEPTGGSESEEEEEEEKPVIVPGSNSIVAPDECERLDISGWFTCKISKAVTGVVEAIINHLILPLLQWRVLV